MKIQVITSPEEMSLWSDSAAGKGGCGLVPTLGALHDGHSSLIRRAARENGRVCVSVFVNPLQFRKKQYLEYPRDLDGDVKKAGAAGADAVFAPSAEDMYPEGFSTRVILPRMFNALKAQRIEWHYKGVLTVVMKLFNIVRPRTAYFGMKDPHQLALIERMVKDLNMPVDIRRCPTVREKSGLARSSRNALLSPEELAAAPVIYTALKKGEDVLRRKGGGGTKEAMKAMGDVLKGERLARLEHMEIVDPATFLPVAPRSRDALLFASVWIGSKRLTDNIRLPLRPSPDA